MSLVNLFFILTTVFLSVSGKAFTCADIFNSSTKFIKEFDRYDSKAQERWSDALQKEWIKIQTDPSLGSEKISALNVLGFSFEHGKVSAPTYREFVKNYLSEIKKRNIALDEAILPALALHAINEKGQLDVRLITPGVDEWPADYQLWGDSQALGRYVIPEMGRGRFPLTRDSHDLFHFVSFLNNPDYMISLRKGIDSIKHPLVEGKNLLRANFFAEFLSTGNLAKKSEILNFLLTPKKLSGNPKSFAGYKFVIDQLSEDALLAHAEKLATNYSHFLVDFGGGVTKTNEKINNRHFTGGDNYFYMLLEKSKGHGPDRMWRESPTHFSVTLLELVQTLKLSPVEYASYLTNLFSAGVRSDFPELFGPKQDLDQVPTKTLHPLARSREIVLELLRLYVARMEFFMWRSVNDMPVERLIQGGLRDLDFDPEVVEFLRDGLGGNSNIHRSFLPN